MIGWLDVDLASPAMLGGARRGLDRPPILRPSAVRGQLRFWCRALAREDEPERLERELFGTTELGQRVTVLPSNAASSVDSRPLFPAKPGDRQTISEMLEPGCGFRLRFRLPQDLRSGDGLGRLQAVVWTWLHLGTLSRRGRRGYGSLLWQPRQGDLLEGLPVFDRAEVLACREDLEEYLRRGLEVVRERLGRPASGVDRRVLRWFRLETIDQVFVGERLAARYDGQPEGMEDLLHGLGRRGSYNAAELGRGGQERLASPVLLRVYPAAGGGYFPVMIWAPYEAVQLEPGEPVHGYLHEKLGFDRSLAGRLGLSPP